MSRRKHRQQSNPASFIDKKPDFTNPTNFTGNLSTDFLVDQRDIVYSLITGAFCVALLFALSEIIHRTNWLAPLTSYFNSLI